jgi:hypothetical protein
LLFSSLKNTPFDLSRFFQTPDRWFDTNGGSMPHMMTVPAVNMVEKQDHYEISLAAPGMKKDERHTRQEFNYTSFSWAFTIPDGAVRDKIDGRMLYSPTRTCQLKSRLSRIYFMRSLESNPLSFIFFT